MVLFPEEMTAQERAALAIWLFMDGWRPTTREVAERCGMGMSGAWMMLRNTAKIIPILQDEAGRWYLEREANDRCDHLDASGETDGDGGHRG